MKYREAIFKAYAYGKPCAVIRKGEDDYEVRKFDLPEGTELVFLSQPMPQPMDPAASDKFQSLYRDILFGKASVRLPGKGIVRRGK